jgi:hypothetical protein
VNVEAALQHLLDVRLASVETSAGVRVFRYGHERTDVDATVGALVRAYDQNRLEIVKLMNANAIQRLRNAALKTFADAFILGGKKKDG